MQWALTPFTRCSNLLHFIYLWLLWFLWAEYNVRALEHARLRIIRIIYELKQLQNLQFTQLRFGVKYSIQLKCWKKKKQQSERVRVMRKSESSNCEPNGTFSKFKIFLTICSLRQILCSFNWYWLHCFTTGFVPSAIHTTILIAIIIICRFGVRMFRSSKINETNVIVCPFY